MLQQLKQELNYSIWCDFIERDFIDNEFESLINQNIIYGATSNPAIFANAINSSDAYKTQLSKIADTNGKDIYEKLALMDIKKAAKKLLPLYQKDNNDGFISIEVDPNLYNNAKETIKEGISIFERIDMPNVMIKIPATASGYEAMKELTSRGINVNATLIFSQSQAINSAKALNEGILKSKKAKGVISVFVSRFDRELNEFFKAINFDVAKLGIMNAIKCYYSIEEFENEHIRTLFASTGVKGKDLEPDYYIKNLIYKNTINTAPLNTIKAYINNNDFKASKIITKDEVDDYFNRLLYFANIDINKVSKKLLADGLEAFIDMFNDMIKNLQKDNK
jgi:transaldolase